MLGTVDVRVSPCFQPEASVVGEEERSVLEDRAAKAAAELVLVVARLGDRLREKILRVHTFRSVELERRPVH
jgi:hypothetical protein